MLDDLRSEVDTSSAPHAQSLAAALEALAPAERYGHVAAVVRSQVARVIGRSEQDLGHDRGLSELGLDSLMGLDLRASLQAMIEPELPASLVFNYPTLRQLTDFVALDLMSVPPPGEVDVESDGLDDLSEAELARLLDDEILDVLEEG